MPNALKTNQRRILCRRCRLAPDTEPLIGHFSERLDPGIRGGKELERRVEHREQCAHRPKLLAVGPFARSIPGLKRRAHRDKAELRVAAVHQQNVLVRPLRRLRRDRKAERFAEDRRQALAVYKVDPARRGGADRQRRRPIRLDTCRPGRNHRGHYRPNSRPQPQSHLLPLMWDLVWNASARVGRAIFLIY
jgi:hypothetical protein